MPAPVRRFLSKYLVGILVVAAAVGAALPQGVRTYAILQIEQTFTALKRFEITGTNGFVLPLILQNNPATAAASDRVALRVNIENSAGAFVTAGQHLFTMTDVISGTEDTDYLLTLIRNGTTADTFWLLGNPIQMIFGPEVDENRELVFNRSTNDGRIRWDGSVWTFQTGAAGMPNQGEWRFYEASGGGTDYHSFKGAAAYSGIRDFIWNIDPSVCTGDVNAGALTVTGVGPWTIGCSTDDGGGAGTDVKTAVFEVGVQVGTVGRRLDFINASDFVVSEDVAGDQFDLSINRNAASGIAGLDSGSRIAKAQGHSATAYTDQGNTFNAAAPQTINRTDTGTVLVVNQNSATAVAEEVSLLHRESTGGGGGNVSRARYNDANTAVEGGDVLWRYAFSGSSGTGPTYADGAILEASAATGWTSTSAPGRLAFFTTPSGSTVPVNRGYFDENGNLVLLGAGDTVDDQNLDNMAATTLVETITAVWTFASAGTQIVNDPVDFFPDGTNGVRLDSSGSMKRQGTGTNVADRVEVAAVVAGTCTLDDTRIDSSGTVRKFCYCSPANTWNCGPLLSGTPLDGEFKTACAVVDAPATSQDFIVLRLERAATVTGIDCIVAAATSAAILVKECDGNASACINVEAEITCTTTNTSESGAIDNPSLDAGDWIRIDPTTIVGTPGHVSICVNYLLQ